MQSTHSEAITRRGEDHAIVYWRPGCPYCNDLLRGLDPDDQRISLVDIWQDPEAADFVASLQDGNELVPTVVIGERVLTAPTAQQLLTALG